MSKTADALGQHRTLSNRLKKTLAASAVSATIAVCGLAPVIAGGETRSISLYHIHTSESLTVTYMKDGRYVPSAMKQINYLLRDWRKNSTITIDPRTIDMVWQLHEDLGSHAPIHIVCGYRSAGTNAMLHRIGRHVARESQHIQGKAIDFYLTDVPTQKIRNVALVLQRGGVGYYRSSGGPTGFLHVDSGHVRHWGPYISPSQMAQIFRDGRKYIGRHMTGGGSFADETAVASADDGGKAPRGFLSKLLGLGKKDEAIAVQAPTQVAAAKPADAAANAAYNGDQNDMADLSADASAAPAKPKPVTATNVSQAQMASMGDLALDAAIAPKAKPAPQQVAAADTADETDVADGDTTDANTVDAKVNKGRVVPKPRAKPIEVMLMAAANMKAAPAMIRISAASAPPPNQSGRDVPSPVADSLGTLIEAVAVGEIPAQGQKPKSSLANDLKNGTVKGPGVIKPMIASAAGSDINWWPQLFLRDDASVRRDGQPPLIGTLDQDALPKAANIGGGGTAAFAADLNDVQHSAEGKGDLVVNEADKVDLGLALPVKRSTTSLQ